MEVARFSPEAMAPLSRKQIRQRDKIQQNECRRQRARDFRSKMMEFVGSKHDVRVAAVQVVGHEEHDGVTYFRLRMTAVDGNDQWEVAQRYSAFDSLRKDLCVREQRVGNIFPTKTGFFKCQESQLLQRQQLLQNWITGLLAEFASHGDGRHAIIPMFREGKLTKLQHFLGIDKEGHLLPNAHRFAPIFGVVRNDLAECVAVGSADANPYAHAVAQPSAPPPGVDRICELQGAFAASATMQRAEEESQLQAAIAASATMQRAEEESKLQEAIAASTTLKRVEDESQLKADAEVIHNLARSEEQARNEEEARFEAAEAEAEQQAVEDEENARREQARKEDDAQCMLAEEEAAHQKQQEEARCQAEQAEKPWLDRAIDLFIKAQRFETQGELQEAWQHYTNSRQMFEILKKRETSEQIRDALEIKIQESQNRAFKIQEAMNAAEVAHVAEILAVPVTVPMEPAAASRIEQSACPEVARVKRVVVAES